MRTFLMTLLAGSSLMLAACQTGGVQSAGLSDNHAVGTTDQGRYWTNIPRHSDLGATADAPYSLRGDRVPPPGNPSDVHDLRVNPNGFVRHATNGNW